MKKTSVIVLIAALTFSGIVFGGDAEVRILEVEDLQLSNAPTQDLPGASGTVVAFESEDAEAIGDVELDQGVYEVSLMMFAPGPDQDAVYVSVGESQKRVYPSTHNTLTKSWAFPVEIKEKKQIAIRIRAGEPGVLLDRLVFQPMSDEAIAEMRSNESDAAYSDLYPTDAIPGPPEDRPRVIVTSDGEIDDECSMVRFLLYSNEWDVEAIITSSSQYHWHGHNWAGDDWMEPYLDAYAQIYPNLKKHDPRYPTPEYLRARTLLGNVRTEGDMDAVTQGSEYIVKVLLDRSDDKPVWLQAWGGPNTIARALKTIQEEHPDQMEYVANKIRFYFIWEQDSTYQAYIRPNWGKYDIPTIISDQFLAMAYDDQRREIPQEMKQYYSAEWMNQNLLEEHGPLLELYKAHENGRFRSEGDTPSFLHVIPTGLRSIESPGYGGWGGRFVNVRNNTWLDPVPEDGYEYPEERWYSSTAYGRVRLRKDIPNDEKLTEYFKPQWRWIDEIQNDFAARADWSVQSYQQANHPPVVKLSHSRKLEVQPGQQVSLSAKNTWDPDGDAVIYRWWQYREADSYPGIVTIQNSGDQEATFTVPTEAEAGETIHVICEVTDRGEPPLTRYQRVIVTVTSR